MCTTGACGNRCLKPAEAEAHAIDLQNDPTLERVMQVLEKAQVVFQWLMAHLRLQPTVLIGHSRTRPFLPATHFPVLTPVVVYTDMWLDSVVPCLTSADKTGVQWLIKHQVIGIAGKCRPHGGGTRPEPRRNQGEWHVTHVYTRCNSNQCIATPRSRLSWDWEPVLDAIDR